MASDRFSKLKARIECAEAFWRRKFKAQEEENLEFYKGNQWAGQDNWNGVERVTTNVLIPVIRAIIPSIIFQYPRFTLNTDDPALIGSARVAQKAVNDFFKRLKGKNTTRRCVLDSLVFRYGVAKTGWNYLEEEVPLTEEEQANEMSTMLDGLMQSGETLPDLQTAIKLIPKTRPVPIKDTPTITRVSTKNFWPDPQLESFGDLEDFDSYVVEHQFLPIERVQADRRFKKKSKLVNQLKGGSLPDYVLDMGPDVQREFKGVRLRHIYYYENSRLYLAIFADDQPEPLFEDDEQGGLVQFPYSLLKNIEVPDQLAGVSEVQDLKQLQRNRNKLQTIILDHDKKFLRKVGLIESEDPDGAVEQSLKHPESGTVIKCQSPNTIFPIPHLDVPGDLWKSLGAIDADIEKRTQISAYMQGLMPDQKRLATEVNAMTTAASAIAEDRLNNTVEFLADIGAKLLKELQVNLSQQVWAEIAPEEWQQIQPFMNEMPPGMTMLNRAPEGVMPQDSRNLHIQFGKDHIQGDFKIDVVVGSTMPESEGVKTKKAMDRYNMFRKDPLINAPLLLEETIEATNPKRDPRSYIVIPPPMPVAPEQPPGKEGVPPEHGGVVQEPFQRHDTAVNTHMMNRGYNEADVQRGVRVNAV